MKIKLSFFALLLIFILNTLVINEVQTSNNQKHEEIILKHTIVSLISNDRIRIETIYNFSHLDNYPLIIGAIRSDAVITKGTIDEDTIKFEYNGIQFKKEAYRIVPAQNNENEQCITLLYLPNLQEKNYIYMAYEVNTKDVYLDPAYLSCLDFYIPLDMDLLNPILNNQQILRHTIIVNSYLEEWIPVFSTQNKNYNIGAPVYSSSLFFEYNSSTIKELNPIRFDYHKINTIKVIDWSHNFEIDSNGNLIEKYNFKGKMNKNPVCPINSITHTVPIHYSERPASFKIIVKSRSGDNLSGKGEFASLIELEKHITEEGGFGYFIDYGPESLLNIVANDSRIADYCEIEYEANNPLYEYFSKKDRYTYELKIPIVFCEEIKDSKLRMDINIPKEFSSSYNYNNNSTVIGSHIRFDLQTNGEPKEALELKLTYNVRNSFIYYIILNITITSLIVLMFILYKKKLNYNKSETYINKTQLKYMSPIFLTIVLGEVANLRASGSFVSLFFLVLDTLTLFSLIFSILLIIFVFIVERNKSES